MNQLVETWLREQTHIGNFTLAVTEPHCIQPGDQLLIQDEHNAELVTVRSVINNYIYLVNALTFNNYKAGASIRVHKKYIYHNTLPISKQEDKDESEYPTKFKEFKMKVEIDGSY